MELPKIINNPFLIQNVTSIGLTFYYDIKGNGKWFGKIVFQKGLTSGMQETKDCETFAELLEEIKKIECDLNK